MYRFALSVLQDKESIKECVLHVRQHEQGVIDIVPDSFHCKHAQPPTTESSTPVTNATDTDATEMLEHVQRQVVNESLANVSFDHEVQQASEHDRPFVAVQATRSDFCPGCPFELNPSLPGLMAFGNQALEAMDAAGHGDFKHKLVAIVRVTRAVPPGSNAVRYQLLMRIGESTCLKSSHVQLAECPLGSNLPVRLCLVTFEEQPWRAGSRRITDNNCTQLLNTDNEVSTDFEAPLSAIPLAELTEVAEPELSTRAEFFDQIAQEAQDVVHHMDMSTVEASAEPDTVSPLSGGEQPKTPEPSDKLRTFDEFLKDYEVSVREVEDPTTPVPGEPVSETLIVKEQVEERDEEEAKGQPTVESTRSKRSAKDLTSDKSLLRKLATRAIELVDELDADDKRKHLIEVLDVERERLDHGVAYHLTVEVAATDCSERDKSTECLDEVIPGATQVCKLNVAAEEKRPVESAKLLHYECNSKRKSGPEGRFKRQIPGGINAISTDHPDVLKYAKHALRQYSDTYKLDHDALTFKVLSATYQVVSGMKYVIKAEMGKSSCGKAAAEQLCEVQRDEGFRICDIDVWHQAWLKDGLKISLKCDGDSERRKRSLRGQNYSDKSLKMWREVRDQRLFDEFVAKYERNYETEDEKERRFQIFRENLDVIEELRTNELGTGQYGVTRFADLSRSEFRDKYLGLKPSLRSENDIPLAQAKIPDVELPAEFDWRHHNVVTPVKNQGGCGSCWAFSVTGNVEGQYAIKHGNLLSLSEQELVDCDKFDDGCGGGLPDTAYKAIEELGGLELESDYPYDAQDEKCHFSRDKVKVRVVSGVNITSNETQMAQWLVANGPMSVGINANAMQFYFGGVSHPYHFLCSPDNLDHGVLIVGYGTKSMFIFLSCCRTFINNIIQYFIFNQLICFAAYPIFKKTMPYWLIKNSWGPHWGEQGYYRIYRGDGSCGVNKMVSSAIIA